jgi:hypothetical protein
MIMDEVERDPRSHLLLEMLNGRLRAAQRAERESELPPIGERPTFRPPGTWDD